MSSPANGTLFAIPIPAFDTPGEEIEVKMGGKSYILRAKCALVDHESFELFTKFPRELRTKVWKFAAEGRVITAFEIPKIKSAAKISGDEKEEAVEYSTFKFEGAAKPEIFQVCKEVEEFAGAMGYKPMFQTNGSSKAFWFNPGIDILDIQTVPIRDNLCDPLQLSKVLANPLELRFIQQLHISVPCFDFQHKHAIKDINSMPALKVFHVHGSFPTFPTCPEFSLKLDFENFEDKGVVPIAKIPGKHLVNEEAVSVFSK